MKLISCKSNGYDSMKGYKNSLTWNNKVTDNPEEGSPDKNLRFTRKKMCATE